MTLLLAAVLTGAILQRVSGIGFAMVVAPFTIIAIGPLQGIVLVQLCGVASAAFVLTRVIKFVDWRAYKSLLPGSAIGIVFGGFISACLPTGPAQIVSAFIVILTLATSIVIGRIRHVPQSGKLMTAAGGAAGTMTVLAGVGGAALTALQQATRWEHRSFVATLQPYFMTLSTGTVIAKLIATPGAWPDLSLITWLGIVAMMVVGIVTGGVLVRWLSVKTAGRITLMLSLLGAVSALIDGYMKL